jgi:hypothetical protein
MQSEAMVLGYLGVPINYGGVSIERAVGMAISKAVQQAVQDRTLFKGPLGAALS